MDLGEAIKAYRKEHRLSTRNFAEKVGCSNAYISRLENGINKNPSYEILTNIAKTMGKDLTTFLSEIEDINVKMPLPQKDTVPLYAALCCGKGLFVDDEIEDYIAIPKKLTKPGKEYFANTASGDSMTGKGIDDGDILVFEKTNILESGNIGAFCVGEDMAICKTFRVLPNDVIILESANDKYEPMLVDVETECFRIIGKLISIIKKV